MVGAEKASDMDESSDMEEDSSEEQGLKTWTRPAKDGGSGREICSLSLPYCA